MFFKIALTRVSGQMEDNMEKECISDHKESKKKENGVKERESNGNKKKL